jgi:hypothetical protein
MMPNRPVVWDDLPLIHHILGLYYIPSILIHSKNNLTLFQCHAFTIGYFFGKEKTAKHWNVL